MSLLVFQQGGRIAMRGPAIERLLARVTALPTGCWVTTVGDNGHGYKSVNTKAGRVYAHRLSFEYFIGPIPEGLHLDHLCNTRACVNPMHLEPVGQEDNNRRAAERRTRCRNGHPWTPENTYIRRDGYRDCRACAKGRVSKALAPNEEAV